MYLQFNNKKQENIKRNLVVFKIFKVLKQNRCEVSFGKRYVKILASILMPPSQCNSELWLTVRQNEGNHTKTRPWRVL
jgi:hypothetical protein